MKIHLNAFNLPSVMILQINQIINFIIIISFINAYGAFITFIASSFIIIMDFLNINIFKNF